MVKRLVTIVPDELMGDLKDEAAERDLLVGEFVRDILRHRELVLAVLDEDETDEEEEAEEENEDEKSEEDEAEDDGAEDDGDKEE